MAHLKSAASERTFWVSLLLLPAPATFLMTSTALRILAVEDDPLLARALRLLVQELGYELLPVAADADQALRFFQRHKPDLALLDVRLKGAKDGIEVGQMMNDLRPIPLIFVTSFQDRETFERAKAVGPFAFLTKPYAPLILERAIELAVQLFARQQQPAALTPAEVVQQSDCLYVRDGNKLTRVVHNEIEWIETDSSFCILHTVRKKFPLRVSLRELEDQLPAGRFVRIHRSHLVQLVRIEQVDPLADELQLVGGQILSIGRAYRRELLARLHIKG